MTATVAILAFDGMEVLDYAGPYEVFNVAGELSGGLFSVISVGVTATPVGRGGFAVLPSRVLEEAPSFDILVVPGGSGWAGDQGPSTRSAAPRVDTEHRRPGGSCYLGVYRSSYLGCRWLACRGCLLRLITTRTRNWQPCRRRRCFSPVNALYVLLSGFEPRPACRQALTSLWRLSRRRPETLRQQVADEMEWMWVLDRRNR